MTRDVARRLVFLLLRASSASAALALAGGAIPACYTGGGGGTDPPTDTFYFPVGLAVSAGGNALYAVNSDFDLQWNGGTLQSYDLFLVRLDAAALVNANLTGGTPSQLAVAPYDIDFVDPPANTNCLADPRVTNPDGTRVELGQICAPPVQSAKYVRSSTIIGAFATDLQLQRTIDGTVGTRLFAPVRGNATLTWSNVGKDDPATVPAADAPVFSLSCQDPIGGPPCANTTGNVVDPQDTRGATMPGEPFGMAQTEDGSAIAVTHQTSTDTSLLTAGIPTSGGPGISPSMQFVETDVATGGSGITFVPHDADSSVPPCPPTPIPGQRCVQPAFLETSHDVAELDLLRYYPDDGSSLHRPFLAKEGVTPFNTNFGGTDSRGIAVDSTPRLACKNMHMGDAAETTICADLPARVFFANRTPPSLVFGEVGGTQSNGDGSYNPDMVTLSGNIPLPAGPSRVYVAPIVNAQGRYEVRVFVVNFDSSTISVYDPNNQNNLALVETISVGPGPFAMAFDPFVLQDVAANAVVPSDTRKDPRLAGTNKAQVPMFSYRFAYVASFTQSFVQVIDLDQRQSTFENVVFTLGNPTPPKGS